MDILNQSRSVGAHAKEISVEDEVKYNVAFDYFEESIK